MTGVLVWKELREQSMAAVALLVLGAGLLIGVQVWIPPGDLTGNTYAGFVLPMILAWMCGLIAGAQPFAVEFENGTMNCLDALPTSRRRLWAGKALAATAVVGFQVALLVGLAASLGYLRGIYGEFLAYPLSVAIPLLAFPLSGLAFGLFGSALGRSPMAAIGWALLVQLIALSSLTVVAMVFTNPNWGNWLGSRLVALFPALATFLSYRIYTRPDRLRRRTARGPVTGPESWRVLLWVAWRQVRWLQAPVLVAGLLTAAILPRTVMLAWPLFGLVFGAVLGVSAFAPDNLGGSVRFLGERRLPLGRVWLVKTAVALMPLAAVFLVLMLGALLIYFTHPHHIANGIQYSAAHSACIIFLGPVYGFAVGQFFGLVCRKGAVAAVLTLLVAGGLFAVWLPSIVVGGLAIWQVFGPPIVLIVATRLAMRPWVAGRLNDWRPTAGIVGAGLLTVGGVAFGVWWRVVGIPAVGPPFDVMAFVASAPTPEKNEGGRKMRLVAMGFEKLWNDPIFQEHDAASDPNSTPPRYYQEAVDGLNQSGWPVGKPNLDSWMDRVFAGEWFPALSEAIALPPGITSSPWPPAFGYADQFDVTFQRMSILLCSRALQFQAQNKHAEALEMYRLALGISRHIRPRATANQFLQASRIETKVLRLLPKWAASNFDRPELLRQAVKMLQDGEAAIPPLTETIETEYLVTRDILVMPAQAAQGWDGQFFAELVDLWRFTPWEQDRTNRIVDLLFAGWMRTAALDYKTAIERRDQTWTPAGLSLPLQSWLPATAGTEGIRERVNLAPLMNGFLDSFISPFMNQLFAGAPQIHTEWRAAQLQIALLLYQEEHGRPAERLVDLTPGILPAVPIDPFDGGAPFHYRVSRGERIAMSPARGDDDGMVVVEAGQGVVWSVSTDTVDDGGFRNGGYFQGFGNGLPGFDLIFLVPWQGKK
jgi:hypothetical protein